MRVGIVCALLAALACSEPQRPAEARSVESQLPTATITLPDGAEIEAELALEPRQQAIGLMYRHELPPGRGMLFVFPGSEPHGFWMYNTRIPLDILWLNESKRIIEISPNTPPCPSRDARDCPSYGGSAPSAYVLELAAGSAARHGLKVGDRLEF